MKWPVIKAPLSMQRTHIVLIALLAVTSLLAIVLSFSAYRIETNMKEAQEELHLGRARIAAQMLSSLEKSVPYWLLARFRIVDPAEKERLMCAALVADKEFEKAVDACTLALRVAHDEKVKHEILFNRASAFIELGFTGNLPKGLSRAIEDLKSVLRTDEHPRAALLLEKLYLIKAGEGKGDPQPGGESRPNVQMFDEAPATGGASEWGGY